MIRHVDESYVENVGIYLERFRKVRNGLWNCRCPLCGDSKSNKRIARGYFHVGRKDGNIIYSCHNCNVGDGGISLGNFLKTLYPNLYSQYKLDILKSNSSAKLKFDVPKIEKIRSDKIRFRFNNLDATIPVDKLPNTHDAVKYLVDRKIEDISVFSYASNFHRYVAEMTSNDPKYDKLPKDRRIIIPLKFPNGDIMGFQGRQIDSSKKSTLRYVTIKQDENFCKIFGLDKFDKYKPGFLVEGAFDSTFLPNSIAMCGASFDEMAIEYGYVIPKNIIVVMDSEPRNEHIVNRMLRFVDSGFRVFVPPKSISTKLKDINNMILDGWTKKELVELFVKNSLSGIKARMSIINWKKV